MDIQNTVVFFIVVIVLQLAISNVAAVDYVVGDENGWTLGINYREWAKDKVFRVGDRLIFAYTPGAQNVVRVKRDAYKNCMAIPTPKALTSGDDVIELTKPGRNYFISSVGDRCSGGKPKLAITVFPSTFFSGKPFISIPLAPAPSPDYGFIWKWIFPPSAAPAPAPISEFPWWRLFFPPSAAPAPAPISEFPWWRLFFPPSAAPAPAPISDFPWWRLFFPPSAAPAPAPTSPFPWKWFFPPTPAPAPTSPFPWKWFFPPTPAPAPTMDFQEKASVASDE